MNLELQTGRIKNTARNTIYGFIIISISTMASFLLRNIMLRYLGADFLGLNSFYQSILEAIGTAELGIGATMVVFLYDPVAKDDFCRINAYTLYIKRAYYLIGGVIIIVGLCVTPFLKCLISSDVPANTNIYALFLMYLISVALSYFLFPEMVFLATAYQRDDYNHKIRLMTEVLMWGIQLIGLIYYKSYFVYIIAQLFKAIEVGLLRFLYEKRKFPCVCPSGILNQKEKAEIKAKILSMVGHQLDSRLMNGIDNIIISAFFGLSAVGIYGNYFLILSTITWFVINIFSSVTSSIANAVISESVESNYVRYKSLYWLNSMIAGWGTVCLLSLYQDFIKIWMGDAYLYEFSVVVLFCVYFYVTIVRRTTIAFKNAMGMWDSDKFKPYVSILCDLILDVILIPKVGAVGAIVASIVSEGLIEFPWENKVLFSSYFCKKGKSVFTLSFKYFVSNFISCSILLGVCRLLYVDGVLGMIMKGLVCTIGFCIVNLLIIYRKNEEFKVWKETFWLMLK